MGQRYSKQFKVQQLNEVVTSLRKQSGVQARILTHLNELSRQNKEDAFLLQEQADEMREHAAELKAQKGVLERDVERLRHVVATLQKLNR